MENGSVTCPSCGKPTPDENLRCIFCGELLPAGSGALGRLRYGSLWRWVFVAAAILVLAYLVRGYF